MAEYQKVCDVIGNDSFEALWSSILYKRGYENIPEYDAVTSDFYEQLEKIPGSDLKFSIEEKVSSFTSLAMYQGFVLGFREAVKLILEDSKK